MFKPNLTPHEELFALAALLGCEVRYFILYTQLMSPPGFTFACNGSQFLVISNIEIGLEELREGVEPLGEPL